MRPNEILQSSFKLCMKVVSFLPYLDDCCLTGVLLSHDFVYGLKYFALWLKKVHLNFFFVDVVPDYCALVLIVCAKFEHYMYGWIDIKISGCGV